MWGAMVARLAVWLVRSARFNNEQRQLLTASMLDRLGAPPLHAIIRIDESGNWFVRGRPLNLDRARELHKGAQAMQRSFARKIVSEQLRFLAVQMGVHENLTPEQGLFAKAVLWVLQEEDKLYSTLGDEQVGGE